MCVSFKGGWEKGQTDISGGTNQLLRVRRTPSLDAGQRSSAFSLRPQHHPWRLPRDRARQHVLKWMCRAFGHCAKSLQMKGTDIVGAKGVAWGGEHTGSLPGPRCLNSWAHLSFPIPGEVTHSPFSPESGGSGSSERLSNCPQSYGGWQSWNLNPFSTLSSCLPRKSEIGNPYQRQPQT